jgi:hypothetical protein
MLTPAHQHNAQLPDSFIMKYYTKPDQQQPNTTMQNAPTRVSGQCTRHVRMHASPQRAPMPAPCLKWQSPKNGLAESPQDIVRTHTKWLDDPAIVVMRYGCLHPLYAQ